MLIQQNNISCKIRITILSSHDTTLGQLTGISEIGSFSIDSDARIRRATDLAIQLDDFYDGIEQQIETYLNLKFRLEIGIFHSRTHDYKYYPAGVFNMTESNTVYDAVSNALTLNLSDRFSCLDGTRNGQVGGSPTITIPVEYEGNKNTLRAAVTSIITGETDISNYVISDIGEYYGMPENNSDYLTYRSLNPDWNVLPYDLEFDAGDTVSDMLLEIRDLYPNCQMYFDIYGNFCFDMIPSDQKGPVCLDNDYIQSILIANSSENVQYDISSIKNVVEVFGHTYEVDRFCENASFSSQTFTLSLDVYDKYTAYELLAFRAPASNGSSTYVKINALEPIPLYREYTEEFIPSGTICCDDMAVIRLMRDTSGNYIAYYLGQYQPHAICALTEDVTDPVYTKTYFAQRYNCPADSIVFVESAGSPFSIQKLGLIPDVKSGDEYDNILSDSVAMEYAKYSLYRSSVWNDTVTINTKLIPFLDVNTKVEYKKEQDSHTSCYIIKKIEHNLSEGTTAITMCRFSALYREHSSRS